MKTVEEFEMTMYLSVTILKWKDVSSISQYISEIGFTDLILKIPNPTKILVQRRDLGYNPANRRNLNLLLLPSLSLDFVGIPHVPVVRSAVLDKEGPRVDIVHTKGARLSSNGLLTPPFLWDLLVLRENWVHGMLPSLWRWERVLLPSRSDDESSREMKLHLSVLSNGNGNFPEGLVSASGTELFLELSRLLETGVAPKDVGTEGRDSLTVR
jgi:hypothetical protein